MFNVFTSFTLTKTQGGQKMLPHLREMSNPYQRREVILRGSQDHQRIKKNFAVILGVFTRLIELLKDFERIFELFCDGDGNEQLEGTLCSCFFQNFHTFSTQPHCFWHRRTGIFRKSRMPSYPCFLLDDCRPPLIK